MNNTEAIATPKINRYLKYKLSLPFRNIISNIQYRARKRNIPCTINIAWAKKTYTGVCSLSNIPFQIVRQTTNGNPYHPSVDRINPKIGYLPENCRWILLCLNAFKGVSDDLMMKHVAEQLLLSLSGNKTISYA